jgi:uncharacterized membrane protein YGL010W
VEKVMRASIDLLSQYAAGHRDRRNIISHLVGVPLSVLAVGVLLARPSFSWAGLVLSPAWLMYVAAVGWYLTRGTLALGLAVSGAMGVLLLLAHQLAQGTWTAWLVWGASLWVVGWAVQRAGHWYEGQKPPFAYDWVSLLIGPMFVTAELLFMLGWNRPLLVEIERRAGAPLLRDMAKIS